MAVGQLLSLPHDLRMYPGDTRIPNRLSAQAILCFRTLSIEMPANTTEETPPGLPSPPPSRAEKVKDCLVHLRLITNPSDALGMHQAINNPTRCIAAKTEQALEPLADSAQSLLLELAAPKFLMSMPDDRHVHELEGVPAGGREMEARRWRQGRQHHFLKRGPLAGGWGECGRGETVVEMPHRFRGPLATTVGRERMTAGEGFR